MNPIQMTAKPLKLMLYMTCISLLLPGCSKETSEPEPKAPGTTRVQSSSTTPDVLPDRLEIKRQEKTYVISGIGLKGDTKVAIINNKVAKPGEEIDTGVVLEDVQPTYAIIRVGNTRHLLRPEDIQRELDRKKQ